MESEEQLPAQNNIHTQYINTASGPAITGDVSIQGDFAGRDKIIHDEVVHGDKVLGDKVVMNEAPKPRIPLQRPPRVEYFQDRKDDLTQILVNLQPGRVVTICGPGGMGKSALAAEVLWHLAPGDAPPQLFPDGILFHSFYGKGQNDLALEHIALSFGEEVRPTPKEAAQRALSGRVVLLLLDGTEEADDLRPILEIRNRCGVLITSRARKDAISFRQDILPLPLDDAIMLLQAWGGRRAADLIMAQRISQLIGRLPLALRLVGRYLEQNEEDAKDYLIWLKETPLVALNQGQRQADSVPLLLERSLNRVSKGGRQVIGTIGLLALAPFSWIIIAETLSLTDRQTRQFLGELVSYGLLIRRDETYEVTHALIHTYIRQQFAPPTAILLRLADYYQLANQQYHKDFSYLNILRPHVIALLYIASERSLWETVNTLAWSIEESLELYGYWIDRKLIIELAIVAAQASQNRLEEGIWLGNLGIVYRNLGQLEQAATCYTQAITITKEIGDRKTEGNWLGNLGLVYVDLWQLKQAFEYHKQALDIAIEVGDRKNEGIWLGNLGSGYRRFGQTEQAIDYHKQALAIAIEISDRRNEGVWLGNLGLDYRDLEQVEQAIEYHKQALAIAIEIGDRRNEGIWLASLGLVYRNLEQVESAIIHYTQALTIAKEIGDRRNEGIWLDSLGGAYRKLGEAQKAIEYHQQAVSIAQDIGDQRNKGIWLGHLGVVYADLGQVEQAATYFAQALTIANAIGDRRYEGIWLGNLGLAHRDLEQMEQAITYYEQALAIAKEIGDRRNEWIWLDSLVLAYQNLKQTDLPLNSSTLAQRVEELRNALQKTGIQEPRDSYLGWDQSWDQRWDQSWPQSWDQNGAP